MNLSPNKTPVEVMREDAFGSTYFRDIYSGINEKWQEDSWKEFVQLKNIDAKFIYFYVFSKLETAKYVVS